MIVAEGLTRAYGEKVALRGLDLRVEQRTAGDRVARP